MKFLSGGFAGFMIGLTYAMWNVTEVDDSKLQSFFQVLKSTIGVLF